MFTQHEIEERFGHTAASIEGPNPKERTHKEIREIFKTLAADMDSLTPDSRQKATAFEHLETAAMWFHKALAHNP
jgi:hypothetical protein